MLRSCDTLSFELTSLQNPKIISMECSVEWWNPLNLSKYYQMVSLQSPLSCPLKHLISTFSSPTRCWRLAKDLSSNFSSDDYCDLQSAVDNLRGPSELCWRVFCLRKTVLIHAGSVVFLWYLRRDTTTGLCICAHSIGKIRLVRLFSFHNSWMLTSGTHCWRCRVVL